MEPASSLGEAADSWSWVDPFSYVEAVAWAVQRIWESFLGYFARLFVFRAAIARSLCDRLILGMTDSDRYRVTTQGAVDPKRIERLRRSLIALGGREKIVDGVHMMLLRTSNFDQKIVDAGGRRVKEDGLWKIIPPQEETEAWRSFLEVFTEFCPEDHLLHTGWSRDLILGKDAEAAEGSCLFRCRGPGGAWESKKMIAGYLGAGIDLCLFNWPGVLQSEGAISEASYYAAAETAYQEVIRTERYDPQKIMLSGFCLGASVAAHLFKDHFREGVRLILENTFTSMEAMIAHLTGFAYLGRVGACSLKEEGVLGQTGFNTMQMLETVAEGSAAGMYVISTENDHAVPPDSYLRLAEACQRCSRAFGELRWNNIYATGHNPHGDEPLHYRVNWNRHLEWFRQQ